MLNGPLAISKIRQYLISYTLESYSYFGFTCYYFAADLLKKWLYSGLLSLAIIVYAPKWLATQTDWQIVLIVYDSGLKR